MKYTSLLLALGLCMNASAALNAPDVPAAREQAAAAGKPALIIWHGSDWMHNAPALHNQWQQLDKNDQFILGQFDEKAEKAENKPGRGSVLGLEMYNLPVGVLLSKDGSFMACYDAATMTAPGNEKLLAAVGKTLQQHERFCELAAQARAATGIPAAQAAGQALSLLTVEDAMRQRELCGIINNQDPKDETGYRSLYALEHMGMYREINACLKGGPEGKLTEADRDFDTAEAYVRATIAKGMLSGERLQQWLAGLAWVQRERMLATKSTDRAALLETFKRIIDIDADSQYGIGAEKLYSYWDPASIYTIEDYYFDSRDLCVHADKEWRINITSAVDGHGRYTISLHQQEGGDLITRNYRLLINGQVVETAENPEESVKSVRFYIPDLKPGDKVEIQLTARYYDGWFGACGHVTVSKDTP